jgi:undecaprenyl-diphosphatase
MNLLDLIIISIVEGLTEFLPVSSTGHMMIAEGLLGVEMTTFVKSFTVIIQLGAILAVVVLYWRKFFYPSADALGKQTSAEGASVQASQDTSRFGQWWSRIWRFYLKLIVGVLPAVVVGLTLKDVIDQNLESVTMVAVMLIIGGVFMLFCDQLFAPKDKAAVEALSHTPVTYRRAFMIGLYQCIAAVLPGTSRSMATIVGGMQQKLTRKMAAEFSFFLAVPTMFGAAVKEVYDLMKHGADITLADGTVQHLTGSQVLTADGNLTTLLLGSLIAFVVALMAVKYFIHYIARYGFRAFGWYRIIVGAVILALPLCGIKLKTENESQTATPHAESAAQSSTNTHSQRTISTSQHTITATQRPA